MKRRAFTLVELLVVIGITMVLIGILLSAMSHAREQAKSIQCLSNLRELGQAAFNYADNYGGVFPIARNSITDEWDFDTTSGIAPGILWSGATNMAIQQCPDYDGKSATATDPYTGYNYNASYVGDGVGELTPLGASHVAPAKVGTIHSPSTVALFGDGQYGSLTNKYMRAPILMKLTSIGDGISLATRTAGTQGYRHLGKTNVCYCDGHADSVSNRYTATGTETGGVITYSVTSIASSGTGFLSADDSAYGGQN